MALGISAGLATDPRKQGAAWANGYSIETDGSTQYVKLATTTDINFLHNGGTLAYWVKFDAITSGINAIGVSTSGKQFYICLLYTSPSPRDAPLSPMPSCA